MKGLIQGLGGFQKGNFEIVVVRKGELQHWWRDNNDPKLPWYLGNGGKPIVTNADQGPSLIQSNFGTKGNFEVLIGYSAELHHFFRDNDDSKLPWYPGNGGKRIVNDAAPSNQPWHQGNGGKPIVNEYALNPSLIQSRFGKNGNFELLVSIRRGIIGSDPAFGLSFVS
jgi:hypothetical protein